MFSRLQLFFLLPSVWSEQMDWGDNPYLVDESVTIQGREHIKLAVVMVGGSIDLECQVTFTSEPVGKIRWKIDGKLTNNAENPTDPSQSYPDRHPDTVMQSSAHSSNTARMPIGDLTIGRPLYPPFVFQLQFWQGIAWPSIGWVWLPYIIQQSKVMPTWMA